MTYRIRWAQIALENYREQLAFIAEDSPQNARLVKARLDRTIRNLGDMPSGRAGRVVGTYEKYIPKTSLIIAYELIENDLNILRVIHASRDWQEESFPSKL